MDRTLIDWSARHNLIARSTVEERWRRHYLDAAQLWKFLPKTAQRLVDLGSGAGFPGLVLAAMGAERGLHVTLVESTGKKAAFLEAAAEAMGLDRITVLAERIEAVGPAQRPDIVTARALARLPKLLGYAYGIGGKSARYVFPKGQDVAAELTEAAKSWQMDVQQHASVTSDDGAILVIDALAPKR